MTTTDLELDVDFIGGQGSLTATEEKAISEFIKKEKIVLKHLSSENRSKNSKRTKATA